MFADLANGLVLHEPQQPAFSILSSTEDLLQCNKLGRCKQAWILSLRPTGQRASLRLKAESDFVPARSSSLSVLIPGQCISDDFSANAIPLVVSARAAVGCPCADSHAEALLQEYRALLVYLNVI